MENNIGRNPYEDIINANQELNKSLVRAAAMRPKIWQSRPDKERTMEAVWMSVNNLTASLTVLQPQIRRFLNRHFGGSGLVEVAVLAVLSQCSHM